MKVIIKNGIVTCTEQYKIVDECTAGKLYKDYFLGQNKGDWFIKKNKKNDIPHIVYGTECDNTYWLGDNKRKKVLVLEYID